MKRAGLVEGMLWSVGGVALAYVGLHGVGAAYEQARGDEIFQAQVARAEPLAASQPEGSLVGRLEIPRLQMTTMIFEGTSESTLDKGIGHFAGSALPAGTGNVVL